MKFHLFLTALFAIGLTTDEASAATSNPSPEAEAVLLGKYLKPISDENWKNIAGAQLTEKYSIITGDTLFDISKKLFGDPKYWPKVWALNNDKITNPHKILPGNMITFSPGTGSSLPGVSIAANSSNSDSVATDTPTPLQKSSIRSTDWKNLPPQKWESYKIATSPEIDALGFDKRNKVSFHSPTGFHIEAIPSKEKLTLLGHIFGSRSESTYLPMDEIIYIHTDEAIQVGETYAITDEPSVLKFKESGRTGYSYEIIGQVKILGVQDNLFIGRILTARGFVARDNAIIPLPAKIPFLTPIPGPSPLTGTVMMDHHFSTSTSAQYKEVFIDRGSDDGIQPGMIFRAYEHNDPSDNRHLTSSDFIIDADLMVIQVSETVSAAIIIQSKGPILEGAPVVLLTDISDVTKNPGFNDKGTPADPKEDLDKLDTDDSLGKDEQRELKQLEKWKNNPEEKTPDGNESPPPPPPGPEKMKEIETPPPPSSDETPPPPPSSSSEAPPPPPGASPKGEEILSPPPPEVSSKGEEIPAPPPAETPTMSLEPPPPPPSE